MSYRDYPLNGRGQMVSESGEPMGRREKAGDLPRWMQLVHFAASLWCSVVGHRWLDVHEGGRACRTCGWWLH